VDRYTKGKLLKNGHQIEKYIPFFGSIHKKGGLAI